MPSDDPVRQHLIDLLQKSQAHAGFEKSVQGVPESKIGTRPQGSPHSLWELLEHIRIAQRDILEFSQSAEYQARKWPDDYWPKPGESAGQKEWDASIKAILADRAAFIKLLSDPKRDLFQPFERGEGQTLMREALLIADHNAYHVGEMVLTRRLLGIWPD